jgi:pilus assembly protein FimV
LPAHDDLGDALKDHMLSFGLLAPGTISNAVSKTDLADSSPARSAFAPNKVAIAALVSTLAVLPGAAWSLGLGKLNVQSALGESLKAEIDVTNLTPEESASLQVKVASPDTYRAAGVDYNQVLGATSISLQRRADGRPYLKINSNRTVQEPFVDVILDLSWSTGRLVREYTLLFDPPVSRPSPVASPAMDTPAPAQAPAPVAEAAPAPTPVTAAEAPTKASDADSKRRRGAKAPVAAASQPLAAEKPVAAKELPKEPPKETPKEPTKEASKPAAPAPAGAATVRVRPGDTLSGIAGRTAKSGVSLDQMLVGLYRNNPDAFLGNNMNRLKSGAVLNVPDADQAKSVSNDEAHQIIVAQSSDFANYRQQLAGAVSATPAQPERKASGKVEAEVQDRKQAAAPAPDKLTLSKGGVAASAPGAEDKLAKARAKQDSGARVAELSKNLDDLRKLKEQAAATSKPVAAAPAPAPVASKPAPAPVPAPVPVAKPAPVVASAAVPAKPAPVAASVPAPAPAPASAVVEKPAEKLAEVAASAPAVVIDTASAPASEAQATAATDQASAASAPASSVRPSLPVAPAAPEAEGPGLLDSLNPVLLAAGGAAVALLAGGLMYLRSRRRADTGETSFLESRLQPDSFFGASGGQRVDTRDASAGPSSMSYSLSQLDAIGDVDPVAEADVYLAYGRDLQAEEILKEALRSTPDRLAVRLKLLEVYAKRRDTKGFEQLAVQMFNYTQGEGEDWAKAQEMGLSIDPENPLYQPGGKPSETPLSVPDVTNDLLGASTVPHSIMPAPSALDSIAPAVPPAGGGELVDLDLDISAPMPLDEVTDSVSPPITAAGDLPPLNLPDVPTTTIQPKAAEPEGMIDLPTLAPEPEGKSNLIDFDFDDDKTVAAAPAAFDMSEISLDLDAPGEPVAPAALAAAVEVEDPPAPAGEVPSDPMARKFELAEEFRQIGDVDGARELLQEVIENAVDGPLKAKAESMLSSLN